MFAMGTIELRVHNPIGAKEVKEKPARRLKDLHRKKIGMVWNGIFRGDETLPYILQKLKDRYPDADIRPYDELPIYPDVKEIGKLAKEKGYDAVIGGNGG
jgi:hypothetical protein